MSFEIFKKTRFSLFLLLLCAFLASASAVFAYRMKYESFVGIEASKIEYIGDFSGGQFGANIATGDFNGDSIDDLIVSSPFASTKGKEWNGLVEIFFGPPAEIHSLRADLTIHGEDSGNQLGTGLAVGDFDNNGLDDVAIGAYNATYNGAPRGKVYIMYGKNNLEINVIDLKSWKATYALNGKSIGGGFGLSLHSADVNQDGITDLLVGSPYASSPSMDNVGLVYVFFGSDERFSLSKKADITFYGTTQGERFGSAITVGEFDNDNKPDIAVGAYGSNRVYVYYGVKNFPSILKKSDLVIINDIENWFGFSLDSGDIDGDLNEDLAISSFPYYGSPDEAKIYIYYGGEKFEESADITIFGGEGEALMASQVLLEDLNNDHKAEIIIGAPGVSQAKSTYAGDVYILDIRDVVDQRFYSIAYGDVSSIIHGENADDWFGYSLEVLDFDGDGFKDLAIGSRYSDAENSVNNGKVFILSGNKYPFGSPTVVFEKDDKEVTRGEFIEIIFKSFDIKNKKIEEIENCYTHKEFCLFNFMAISSYDDIQLEPDLILFPDVKPGDQYYEDIVISTILGLFNGYVNEENSPFHPEKPITRIQALKVIFGALDIVVPKYKYELITMLGSYTNLLNQNSYFKDVNSQISYMWWYPRYVNFAIENNIIDEGEYFRPDDNISTEELDDLIKRTSEYLKTRDEETDS